MMWVRASHKLTLPGASTATLAAAESFAVVLCRPSYRLSSQARLWSANVCRWCC